MITLEGLGKIKPCFVARGVVEVGDPMIRRAWSYLSGWAALERAGMPAKLRRELLSRSFVESGTEVLLEVRRWSDSNSRSLLVVIGDMGIGKSFAGGDWLLGCHRGGRGVKWVSCPSWSTLPLKRDPKRDADRNLITLADEELIAREASAVVLDDLGSGNLSPFLLERFNTLLLERDAGERPTIVFLNNEQAKSKDEAPPTPKETIRRYIDVRILDRMRAGGGRTVVLKAAKSLRRKADDDDLDNAGRGRAWRAAAAVIDRVGCLDTRTGGSWSPEQSATPSDPEFGWRLERALSASDDPLADARAVCAMLRADQAEVVRVALELAEQDERFASLGVLPSFVADLREKVEGERRRVRAPQAASALVGAAPPPLAPSSFARLEPGERAKLAARGIRVIESTLLGQFEVRYKPEGFEPREGAGASERKHGRLLAIAESELAGWASARSVFEPLGEEKRVG